MSFLDSFRVSNFHSSIQRETKQLLDRIECQQTDNGCICVLWDKSKTKKLGTHEGSTLEEAKRKAIKQEIAINLYRDNQELIIEKTANTITVAGEVLPLSEYEIETELEKLESVED